MAVQTRHGRAEDVMGKVNGIVLWEGVSAFDGAPLVCVATTGSKNRKTGALVQTWIIRADVGPADAVAMGQDASVCGTCPHRHFLGGDCYVVPGQAPGSVFRAYKRGAYARRGDAGWAEMHGRMMRGAGDDGYQVRAGSYGDPALVPADVWARLNVVTGYSHAWRMPWAQAHRAWMMASCDGPGDLARAREMGWRAFVVVRGGDAPDGTVECPSARGVACADCRLCGGAQRAGAKDVRIEAHGVLAARTGGMERVGHRRLPVLSV